MGAERDKSESIAQGELAETGYPPGLVAYLKDQVQSTDLAREIAQEAVVRYLAAPNRDGIESPARYIFRIAFNLLQRVREDRARSRSLDSDLPTQKAVSRLCATDSQPEDQCLLREQIERMYAAIPPNYRQVLYLHKVEGKTNHEIAQALNITPDSVFVYLSRALAYAFKSQQ